KSYEESLLATIRQNDRDTLTLIDNYLSELVDHSKLAASGLMLDPDFIYFQNDGGNDEFAINQRLDSIRRKMLSFPNIHSLVIYDKTSDSYYFTLTKHKYASAAFIDPALVGAIHDQDDLRGLIPHSLPLDYNYASVTANLLSVVVFA